MPYNILYFLLALFIFLLPLSLTSCKKKQDVSLPVRFHQAMLNSSTAEDQLNLLGAETEKLVPQLLSRVYFTPKNKSNAIEQLQKPLQSLRIAASQKADTTFTPSYPFEVQPYHKGWQILGKALQWSIEKSVHQAPDQALTDLITATGFGFSLIGKGALDASLGLSIVDHARNAFLPALSELSVDQLDQLAKSLQKNLENKPSLVKSIQNEHQNMLASVQYIQDAYTQGKLKEIQTKLGPDIKGAITYLQRLSNKKPVEAVQYFDGLTSEANEEVRMLAQDVQKPLANRLYPNHSFDKNRPWRKFSKHFFGTLRPLVMMHDRTVAWTRLLALRALILKEIKQTKKAPKNLLHFPKTLYEDPFSGQPFVYHADGCDFKLYSVGENLIDDGGQSDITKFRPDLVLE